MTLEIYQLLDQIERAAGVMSDQHQAYAILAAEAVRLLHQHSNQLEQLRAKAQAAQAKLGGAWRSALPCDEPIGVAYDPSAYLPPVQSVMAADGSQIFPDRHGIAYYALVNIGSIHMRPGSGEAPDTRTYPTLLYGDRLRDDETAESLQAAQISRLRDQEELSTLIDLSLGQPEPVVALMDSPLLLWILGESDPRDELVDWFASQLARACNKRVRLAGYVDRPGSRGVANLLALTQVPDDQISAGSKELGHFADMPDRTFFRTLLGPGQRSALFISTSPVNLKLAAHDDELQIAFFYLNVGAPGDPVIARVETPCWVANDRTSLGQLHWAIWQQCQAPGRYPYALARAHEMAVVNVEQRSELENMLASAMLARGVVPQTSAKSFLKALTGG